MNSTFQIDNTSHSLANQGGIKMTNCPECDGTITLPSDAMDGEIIRCDDCGVELEVLSVDPASVGLAPEIQEDWGE